jgi:hypothetical protein
MTEEEEATWAGRALMGYIVSNLYRRRLNRKRSIPLIRPLPGARLRNRVVAVAAVPPQVD